MIESNKLTIKTIVNKSNANQINKFKTNMLNLDKKNFATENTSNTLFSPKGVQVKSIFSATNKKFINIVTKPLKMTEILMTNSQSTEGTNYFFIL